jgi:REP element-mobilizing transposase RayT
VTYYRRHLPHWFPDGAVVFVTWRLYGTLPGWKARERAAETAGREFVAFDRLLDRAQSGPDWLRRPAVASAVAETLIAGEMHRELYRLLAWVVMPNHVHALWRPVRPMTEVMRWVKGSSARRINRMLGREGEHFWQEESFDRWIRSEWEGQRILRYIEENPVKAGLVRHATDWDWSSASRTDFSLSFAK